MLHILVFYIICTKRFLITQALCSVSTLTPSMVQSPESSTVWIIAPNRKNTCCIRLLTYLCHCRIFIAFSYKYLRMRNIITEISCWQTYRATSNSRLKTCLSGLQQEFGPEWRMIDLPPVSDAIAADSFRFVGNRASPRIPRITNRYDWYGSVKPSGPANSTEYIQYRPDCLIEDNAWLSVCLHHRAPSHSPAPPREKHPLPNTLLMALWLILRRTSGVNQCSRIRILRFFQISKKHHFLRFLKCRFKKNVKSHKKYQVCWMKLPDVMGTYRHLSTHSSQLQLYSSCVHTSEQVVWCWWPWFTVTDFR